MTNDLEAAPEINSFHQCPYLSQLKPCLKPFSPPPLIIPLVISFSKRTCPQCFRGSHVGFMQILHWPASASNSRSISYLPSASCSLEPEIQQVPALQLAVRISNRCSTSDHHHQMRASSGFGPSFHFIIFRKLYFCLCWEWCCDTCKATARVKLTHVLKNGAKPPSVLN